MRVIIMYHTNKQTVTKKLEMVLYWELTPVFDTFSNFIRLRSYEMFIIRVLLYIHYGNKKCINIL